MGETYCLQCGSGRVHRSRRRSAIEFAIALAGWRVRRCHDCSTRYLQFGSSLVRANQLKRLGKGLLYAALAAAAVGAIVGAILWFSHSQSPALVEGYTSPAAIVPING